MSAEIGRIRSYEAARANPAGVLGAVLLGASGAAALSFAYVLICHYCPLIYLNVLVAFGYCFLVGSLCRAGIRAGRVSSPAAAAVAGLIVGVFMAWVAWPAYFWLYFDYDLEAYWFFLTNPGVLLDAVSELAGNPMWTLRGSKPAGAWFYYAAWIAEALFLTGGAMRIPWRFARENKLCPDCGKWLAPTGEQAFFGPGDWEEAERGLREGRFDALLALPRTAPEDAAGMTWLVAKGYACPACEDGDPHVTVESVAISAGKKKNEIVRRATVIARFVEADAEAAAALFGQPEEPAAGEPEGEAGPEPEPGAVRE